MRCVVVAVVDGGDDVAEIVSGEVTRVEFR